MWVGESAVWYISTGQTSFPFDCKTGDTSVPHLFFFWQILTHPSRLTLGSHPWRHGRGWPLPHQLVAVMRPLPQLCSCCELRLARRKGVLFKEHHSRKACLLSPCAGLGRTGREIGSLPSRCGHVWSQRQADPWIHKMAGCGHAGGCSESWGSGGVLAAGLGGEVPRRRRRNSVSQSKI